MCIDGSSHNVKNPNGIECTRAKLLKLYKGVGSAFRVDLLESKV